MLNVSGKNCACIIHIVLEKKRYRDNCLQWLFVVSFVEKNIMFIALEKFVSCFSLLNKSIIIMFTVSEKEYHVN